MAIKYSCIDSHKQLKDKRKVTRWIKQTIENEHKTAGDITIVLCSDEYILTTNREFLKHDYFTDIITFDYNEGDKLSGDLLISTDTVKNNADTYKVSFVDELHRVIIHGVLHLCGYKDKSASDAKMMRAKEDFYLAKYDI